MSAHRLFDAPNAEAQRRLAIYNYAGTALVVVLVAFAIWQLYAAGQFASRLWAPFLIPGLWRTIGEGLMATARAAVWCILLSLVFGILLALGRLSRRRWVSVPVTIWIEFNRSIPSLLVILLLYITCSRVFVGVGATLDRHTWSWLSWLLGFQQLGTLAPLVIAVVAHHSTIVAEVVRSGILAVEKGQTDAGLSLGLHPRLVMRLIVIPQALRGMMPALISECVRSLKATTLGYAIGYVELLRTGQIISAALHNPIPMSIVMTGFFVAICFPLTWYAERMEQRLKARQSGAVASAPDPSGGPTSPASPPPNTIAPAPSWQADRP